MPEIPNYPGVHLEEFSSALGSIARVGTSTAAFVGYTALGSDHHPTRVVSFAEFEKGFGGLDPESLTSYAVSQFFANGGTEAIVVRVPRVGGTTLPGPSELIGSAADSTGMAALEGESFDFLCLPDVTRATPSDPSVPDFDAAEVSAVCAAAYDLCERRRAVYLVDPPLDVRTPSAAADWISSLPTKGPNAAAYFPRLSVVDPLDDSRLRSVPPCGTVAGVIARIDGQRGVWRAPAGTEATLRDVAAAEYDLTDEEQATLDQRGLNCVRSLPGIGLVVWGARTLDGADATASEWKYLPVYRLALMIEESLLRGAQWAVFEPNGATLWSQLRLKFEEFMTGLFQQGAFQGTRPAEAFFVRCDAQTTTQADIDGGLVNALVGFAPLKPAEFIVIRLQLRAGPPVV